MPEDEKLKIKYCVCCDQERSSFLAGNEYMCLGCHDTFSSFSVGELIRYIGKLIYKFRKENEQWSLRD